MAQIPEHRGSPGSVVVQEDAVHQHEARRRRLNTFWLLGLQVASEPTLICSLKSIQKKKMHSSPSDLDLPQADRAGLSCPRCTWPQADSLVEWVF